MVIINAILKFFGSLIFVFSLGILIFTLSLVEFTSYNTLQPAITNMFASEISKQVDTNQTQQIRLYLINECNTTGKENVELPNFSSPAGGNLTFKCSEIIASKPEDLPKIIGKQIFDNIYFMNYNCAGALDCFQNLPENQRLQFILSEHFNKSLNQIVIYSLVAIGVSIVLLAISIRAWYGVAKVVGTSSIFNGLLYFVIPSIKTIIFEKIPQEGAAGMQPILELFFNSLNQKLLFVLIAGIILTLLGFVGSHFAKSKKENEMKKGKSQKHESD